MERVKQVSKWTACKRRRRLKKAGKKRKRGRVREQVKKVSFGRWHVLHIVISVHIFPHSRSLPQPCCDGTRTFHRMEAGWLWKLGNSTDDWSWFHRFCWWQLRKCCTLKRNYPQYWFFCHRSHGVKFIQSNGLQYLTALCTVRRLHAYIYMESSTLAEILKLWSEMH